MKSARTAVQARPYAAGAAARPALAALDGGDHVYRVIEVVGTSKKSISDAIDRAIARAHKTLRNLRWFEVMRTSGHIENGKVRHYQVTLSVGFTMEEPG
jgi:dodecin